MSEPRDRQAAATLRNVERVVATIILLFGAVVTVDSWRLGARWAEDGPQAGYFPFYVGLLITIASAVILGRAVRSAEHRDEAFVERGQLRLILALLVPSVIYTALIHVLGIYVASVLFIGYFMMRIGRYALPRAATVALGVSVVFFLIFEIWFKVPLPKGPLEALFGLG